MQLTKIYTTHGHGDHFFGITTLLERFPGVEPIATAATIERMKQQIDPKFYKRSWGLQFAGQIDQPFHLAMPLPKTNEFHLEGHVLRAIEV
jgi:glyoxylase-like metal-dependent hydrolase (beta-lactamase superfamily II)